MPNSTVPADLLELQSQLNSWRRTRKYLREPITAEIRQAAAEMSRRYSPSFQNDANTCHKLPPVEA